MILKFVRFEKYKLSPQEFEKTVQSCLTELTSVSELKLWEMSNGDVAVQMKLREEPNHGEEFVFFTNVELNAVEELVNQTLESIARADKAIKHLDVTTSGKSPRAIVAMIVGHSGQEKSVTETAKAEQHPATHVEPIARAEQSQRRGNRKASKGSA